MCSFSPFFLSLSPPCCCLQISAPLTIRSAFCTLDVALLPLKSLTLFAIWALDVPHWQCALDSLLVSAVSDSFCALVAASLSLFGACIILWRLAIRLLSYRFHPPRTLSAADGIGIGRLLLPCTVRFCLGNCVTPQAATSCLLELQSAVLSLASSFRARCVVQATFS